MTEKITPEQVNRMMALCNEMVSLRKEGVGILSISPYNGDVQLELRTLLELPGELEEAAFTQSEYGYRYEYSKQFGGRRFYALSKERIVPKVEVLA